MSKTIVAIKNKKKYKGGGFYLDYPHPLYNRWGLDEEGLDTYREFLLQHLQYGRGVVYYALKALFFTYNKSNRIVLMADTDPKESHCQVLKEFLEIWSELSGEIQNDFWKPVDESEVAMV